MASKMMARFIFFCTFVLLVCSAFLKFPLPFLAKKKWPLADIIVRVVIVFLLVLLVRSCVKRVWNLFAAIRRANKD
jgi:hypothetical protein